MIWQNAWALAGLGAIILPILIHLLVKHRARTLKFPTLRFVHPTAVVPTRRTRLTDPLLLLVRIAIIACAAAALAQPLFATAHRSRSVSRAIARAVIVDTSASMQRASLDGATSIDRARHFADSIVADANAGATTIAPTSDLFSALPGVIAWLRTQPGQRELTIVSDFQEGSIDSTSIARAPDDITVRLVRLDAAAGPPHDSAANSPRTLALIAAPNEDALAQATLEAAYAVGAPKLDTDSSIVVIFPRARDRNGAPDQSRTPARAWMIDIAARMRTDAQLASAAAIAPQAGGASGDTSAPTTTTNAIVLARAPNGAPLALATSDSAGGRARLVILSLAEPGTLVAAALVAATLRAAHNEQPLTELEPATIPVAVLHTWERNATSAGPRADQQNGDASDGRWLWIAVLALIGIETWLRRRGTAVAAPGTEILHDRAA